MNLVVEPKNDLHWMKRALELARYAVTQDEVPVGAVVVMDDEIVGEGWNQPISHCDPTSHAEILALRQAARYCNNYRLLNSTLYVTLEPCAMCLGAMLQARVKRLVFGARDPRAGVVGSVVNLLEIPQFNHHIEWKGGLLTNPCAAILKDFFIQRR